MSQDKPTFSQQLFALVSLALVSTGIGVSMKLSQVGGQYGYSPASVVVMTELYKLIISFFVIVRVIYAIEKGGSFQHELTKLFRENISTQLLLHQLGLAFSYAIVNLVTFSVLIHASASMFFLLKASSPVVTAILLRLFVGRNITSIQWVSILAQCIGLVSTQYNPCTHTSVISALGYFLMFTNISVSCGAGVWNEYIIKNLGTSVNVQNAVLYTFGILINVFIFWVAPPWMLGVSESFGFFEGYNWRVVFVIIANGSVGLVITAVYKYADVVVKTFGLAGSTMVLYILERAGAIPRSNFGVATEVLILGAGIVFYASYLYIAPAVAVPKSEDSTENGNAPSAAAAAQQGSLMPGGIMQTVTTDKRVMALLGAVLMSGVFAMNASCDTPVTTK